MARKRKRGNRANDGVKDFRHAEAKRRNNPPAGIAPTYEVRQRRTTPYQYDPHLDPQLVWAGKAEHTSFEVDIVSLHIHERISTQAILNAVRRPEPVQFTLFGETPLPADQEIEFYRHEVGWTNRLILGDSLLVMNSLLVKEGMAGKVQMIYMDPPYGIKYSSNFQPRIDRRDVKDRDEDLTHEPEQIKAYRDTWQLGIHFLFRLTPCHSRAGENLLDRDEKVKGLNRFTLGGDIAITSLLDKLPPSGYYSRKGCVVNCATNNNTWAENTRVMRGNR